MGFNAQNGFSNRTFWLPQPDRSTQWDTERTWYYTGCKQCLHSQACSGSQCNLLNFWGLCFLAGRPFWCCYSNSMLPRKLHRLRQRAHRVFWRIFPGDTGCMTLRIRHSSNTQSLSIHGFSRQCNHFAQFRLQRISGMHIGSDRQDNNTQTHKTHIQTACRNFPMF